MSTFSDFSNDHGWNPIQDGSPHEIAKAAVDLAEDILLRPKLYPRSDFQNAWKIFSAGVDKIEAYIKRERLMRDS